MKNTLNRRQFLAGSLAATAACTFPMIVPARAFGQDGAVAPSNRITLGCIGVGGMGTDNMKNFLGLPDCQVVAVCDAYADRRQRAKDIVDAQYGDTGCAMYGDFREVLARDDIDAVMIAVQDHWHALIATAAAKAGKDMYCEKPLGVSVEESRAIRDAVRGNKRVFQTGTWQRSLEKFSVPPPERVRGEITVNWYRSPLPTQIQGSMDPGRFEGFGWKWRGPPDLQKAGGRGLVPYL